MKYTSTWIQKNKGGLEWKTPKSRVETKQVSSSYSLTWPVLTRKDLPYFPERYRPSLIHPWPTLQPTLWSFSTPSKFKPHGHTPLSVYIHVFPAKTLNTHLPDLQHPPLFSKNPTPNPLSHAFWSWVGWFWSACCWLRSWWCKPWLVVLGWTHLGQWLEWRISPLRAAEQSRWRWLKLRQIGGWGSTMLIDPLLAEVWSLGDLQRLFLLLSSATYASPEEDQRVNIKLSSYFLAVTSSMEFLRFSCTRESDFWYWHEKLV